jgi:hypothetical protein
MIHVKFSSILFAIVLLYQVKGCAQPASSCKCSIMLDECGISHFFKTAPDNIDVKLSETKKAKIVLNDCMGDMHFKLYENNVLTIDGSYINATDTSIVSVVSSDIVTGNDITRNDKIFKPRKNGSWFYYDEKGKLLREDVYKAGVLIESKKK